MTERVLIMGAAGRDFHDFNTAYRGRDDARVVAFTAAPGQNLGETAEGGHERYPPELAGEGYPEGIPISPESELEALVREEDVDTVVFSYSDVSHETVMHAGSRAIAAGADFEIRGPETAMIEASVPVIAVDAVRTGCGKSQVSRALADELQSRGVETAVVREPMPYGDLVEGRVRRFETMADLDEAGVTIEEREEYEQHIERGHVVYAGVDYADVIGRAADEADVLLWDGGNNELPFVEPDLHVVLCDPLRAGAETRYHPGEANLRMADYALVNKENSAEQEDIEQVVENVESVNPDAEILHADSVVSVENAEAVDGAEVLVVEDGPTLTHGDASTGAGTVAAEQFGAAARIDPEPHAVGSVADTLAAYPHLDRVLPAMGYSEAQIADLEATIENADPELVLAGTPHDLGRVVDVDVPVVRVRYRVEPKGWEFAGLLDDHADALGLST
ncbi:GTPase [Halolamina salina]|uniref:GTPase n=1 Tax=Halolamina salina TaxID=1220023 RepID=A0ABD6B735_9EURY